MIKEPKPPAVMTLAERMKKQNDAMAPAKPASPTRTPEAKSKEQKFKEWDRESDAKRKAEEDKKRASQEASQAIENAQKKAIHEQQKPDAIKKQNDEAAKRAAEARRVQSPRSPVRLAPTIARKAPPVQTKKIDVRMPSSKIEEVNESRRNATKKLFGGALGLLAAATGSVFVGKKVAERNVEEQEPKTEEAPGIDKEFARWYLEKSKENKFRVLAGDLVGKAFGGTGKILTSSEGRLNQEHTFDSINALSSAWNIKTKNKGLSEMAAKNRTTFLEEFGRSFKHKMTLQQYVMNIDEVLRRLKVDFDFEKFGAAFNLSGPKIELFKRIMNKVDAKAMIAYALTEIGPVDPLDEKGLVPDNIKLLDFALRTGGSEFVDFIPSMHDSLLSFGPYQLTRYAVGNSPVVNNKDEVKKTEDGRVITKPDGALIANKFVRGEKNKISTRLGDIRGAEHHRAAWLLAAVHVALVLRKLDDGRVALIENEFTKFATLVGFLGACHNKMSCTDDYANWLNGGAMGTPIFKSDVYKHYKRSVNNAKAIERFGLNISYDSETKRRAL
jgi:hypothetical protein